MTSARATWTTRRPVLAAICLVLTACDAAEPDAPADVAAKLGSSDRTLAAALAPRSGAWAAEDGWLVSEGWRRARELGHASLGARLGASADAPFEVGLARFEQRRLRLRRDGARPSEIELDRGRATFRGAYPSTDVVDVATPSSFEELYVLRDARAPAAFSWTIDLPEGITAVRAGRTGTIAFADRKGRALLKVRKPFAVDANGMRRDATLSWKAPRLTVRLDPAGLTYPVVLDPTIDATTAMWTQKNPTTMPPLRYGGALTYDPDNKRVLLFGGAPVTGSGPFYADTWSWNGSDWIELTPGASPTPPRVYAGLVYDSKRHVAVLYGGDYAAAPSTSVPLDETWEFDGSTWTQGPAGPPRRSRAGMAFDEARNVTVVFGGEDTITQLGDLWEYDGSWRPVTFDPASAPANRSDASMVYDGHGVTVFGGYHATVADGLYYLNDAWRWDGSVWRVLAPGGTSLGPTPREATAAAFDAARRKIVQFGGYSEQTYFTDTWELDPEVGTWLETSPTDPNDPTKPVNPDPSFAGYAMAYDRERREMLLHGSPSVAVTWTYRAYGGTCAGDDDCDFYSCIDGFCCADDCPGGCRACNVPGREGSCANVLGPPVGDAGVCAATCASGVARSASICDGDGGCAEPDQHRCYPFACKEDGDACQEACATDRDCAKGTRCDSTSNKCVEGSVCADEHTARGPVGETDCAPFRCESGHCLDRCASSADCVGGTACAADHQCKTITATAGGCGCRTSRDDPREVGAVLLALLGSVAWAGRRRSR